MFGADVSMNIVLSLAIPTIKTLIKCRKRTLLQKTNNYRTTNFWRFGHCFIYRLRLIRVGGCLEQFHIGSNHKDPLLLPNITDELISHVRNLQCVRIFFQRHHHSETREGAEQSLSVPPNFPTNATDTPPMMELASLLNACVIYASVGLF